MAGVVSDKNRLFECYFGRLRWLPTLFVLLLTRARTASTQSLTRARFVCIGYQWCSNIHKGTSQFDSEGTVPHLYIPPDNTHCSMCTIAG